MKGRVDSVIARVSSAEAVVLFHADGTKSVWRGNSRLPDAKVRREPKFTAIELPDDLLLRRRLLLPRMSQANAAAALQLEVSSNSPFPAEDLAWGFLVHELDRGEKQIDIVLSSKRHVAEYLQSRWPELATARRQPEVWALGGQASRIVLQGYGESRRLQAAAVQRGWNWALLGLALTLATLAALTPTIQLRERSIQAIQAFDALSRRVAPLVRKRDELSALNDRVHALDLVLADRVDPAGVMEYLTRILPDDTYLYSLDVQKTKITASGHTGDASALLQKLSTDPRLKNVRSPTAVTRMPGATKEAFVVEFTMDPVQVVPAPPPGSAAGVTPAPAATATPGATGPAGAQAAAPVAPTAPVAAVPAPAAVLAKPTPPPRVAGQSPFVVGGSR